MCLAMPGKIISIKKDNATIQYPGQTKTAKMITTTYRVGDYVFVSAGIIVQKIPKKEARESLAGWKDVS